MTEERVQKLDSVTKLPWLASITDCEALAKLFHIPVPQFPYFLKRCGSHVTALDKLFPARMLTGWRRVSSAPLPRLGGPAALSSLICEAVGEQPKQNVIISGQTLPAEETVTMAFASAVALDSAVL